MAVSTLLGDWQRCSMQKVPLMLPGNFLHFHWYLRNTCNYRVKLKNLSRVFPDNMWDDSVNFKSNTQNANVLWLKKYKGFGSFRILCIFFSNHQITQLSFSNSFICLISRNMAKYSVWLLWKWFVHLDKTWPDMCLWFVLFFFSGTFLLYLSLF